MKMRILCWSRNEADILEAHARHHVNLGAEILYVLHRCRDNSEEILSSLKNEGLPIRWHTDNRILHEQEIVLTELMKKAVDDNIDWVIPLDTDEFLKGEVYEVFAEEKNPIVCFPWEGYLYQDHEMKQSSPFQSFQWRRKKENPEWKKVAINRKMLMQTPNIKISPGSHSVLSGDGIPLNAHDIPLTIGHFPVRSIQQILLKIVGAYLSLEAITDLKKETGFHWRSLYREIRSKKEINLRNISYHYASESQKNSGWMDISPEDDDLILDPIRCNVELKYPVRMADPKEVLSESVESLGIDTKMSGELFEILDISKS